MAFAAALARVLSWYPEQSRMTLLLLLLLQLDQIDLLRTIGTGGVVLVLFAAGTSSWTRLGMTTLTLE